MKHNKITTKTISMTGPTFIDEKTIVAEILRGNERALRFFYHYYQRSLTSYIKKRIDNKEDVEEILQDTLLATIEGLRDFAFRSSLFTFICSIANHKIIDFYRRKKIKNIVFSKLGDIETLLSNLIGPEDSYDAELLRQKIKATFKNLTPNYRVILRLKYIYGYSVEEIARKLSISFKSAESQLFRARKAFAAVYHYEGR
ncbi:hypothetical protein A2960_06325 [Candidatus Gottesmanbacteria bacterium RIFCSPLOWO2_01_FULL_39_12b]|uniref:RNA polymerase sigma factor n=1 Tax=Candidatus Gottesmanbacteria bacterium RIFCSPLOWO2_01_FULL_39_12b TaxID=1798388 RepID=A0A1F6AP47_9BACT|nr:MAG: hypothetical protein A2960_06325 [Candidatus Gottesmanbacteria bacterium RIFCSPLOWO2_01_FULL_39_12b]